MNITYSPGLGIEELAHDLCERFEDKYNESTMIIVLMNILSNAKYDLEKLWKLNLSDSAEVYDIISTYYPCAGKPRIYVGRWDMLPEEWSGILRNLNEKTEDEITREVCRQRLLLNGGDDGSSYCPFSLVNVYRLKEFEETFNNDLVNSISTEDYWIKTFTE